MGSAISSFLFFLIATATTETYTLSLHDALPIYRSNPDNAARGNDPAGRNSNLRADVGDRKSTRLNSSHANISYAVFCLKKKIVLGNPSCAAAPFGPPTTQLVSQSIDIICARASS